MTNQKNWPYILAKYYIFVLILIGFIGPLFTTSAPWKIKIDNQTKYPAWSTFLDQNGLKDAPTSWELKDWSLEEGIKTQNLVPYDATYMDLSAVGGTSPSKNDNHLLGTDLLGRDVLSGLIEGCSVSVKIGFISIFFILLFSLLFSISSAYFGNDRLRLNILQIITICLFCILGIFYFFIAFKSPKITITLLKFIIFLFSLYLFISLSQKLLSFQKLKSFYIPLDKWGLKIYELYTSIPNLIILLILIGIQSEKGIFNLSLTFGILVWPVLYRYLRIEFLQEKARDSFVALRNMGFSDIRIIFIHLLPSMFKTIITPITFIFISVIISEATLSFLGLGLSDDIISWGKILAQARQRIDAWWLVLYPGILLFLSLYSLNIIAKKWSYQTSKL